MMSLNRSKRLPSSSGNGTANSSDDPATDVVFPQVTRPPYTEREALPEPSRAIVEALRKNSSLPIFWPVTCSSMLTRQRAKAAMEEADEAIPVEWGKLFSLRKTSSYPV